MSVEAVAETVRADADTLFTPDEAAAFLTLSRRTLDNWRRSKVGPAWVRLGLRRVAYPRSECEAWMAGRRLMPAEFSKTGAATLSEAA